MALEGDENISSAAITHDGGLLAVATTREVKIFQLLQTGPEAGSSLRIRKLDTPSISAPKLVRFAPDGKWLTVITTVNEVNLARIIRSDDPMDRPRILPKLLSLQRLRRDTWQSPLNGIHGTYNQSISHADFSADGAVFAVADLGGYIDTWVTEGHEDPTAPELDVDESALSSNGDDESENDEDFRRQITFLGQRWIRNPSAHLLPRLDSTPVLLSFEPVPEESRPEPNGNPAVHPTRHNPHPHSHDIPHTEHRLLAVSATHQLFFFDVLAGRLSEWSRRNPPTSYPSQYRMLKSPAKGCIWHVQEQQRIWLYGDGWLFMFDLSQDLPVPDSPETSLVPNSSGEGSSKRSKKRKREAEKDISRKGVSGAGDAVREKDAPVTRMSRFKSGQDNTAIRTTQIDLQTAAESDEEVDDNIGALADLRRSTRQDGVSRPTNPAVYGDSSTAEMDLTEAGNEDTLERRHEKQEHWWHTFKYRPILGMVPIGRDDQPLEVVLVERPSWDLDLPPRFVGAHE